MPPALPDSIKFDARHRRAQQKRKVQPGCNGLHPPYNLNVETSLQINVPAPDFSLSDLKGRPHRLSDYRGRIAVVNFWSAECPWSARADKDLHGRLPEWGDRVAYLPVAANANEPARMLADVARQRGFDLVLLDPGAGLASRYGAVTTPHLFVVDAAGVLRYRGGFNNFSFAQRTPTQHYLNDAVEALLAGRLPGIAETPPYGCALVHYQM